MRVPPRTAALRPNRRTTVLVVAAVFAILVLLGVFSAYYTDVLWFEETGFEDVFWTSLRTKVLLGVAFGAAFAALLVLNLWIAQRITSPARVFSMRDQVIERYRLLLRPHIRRFVIGGSLLFGLFAGSSATSQWRNWLLFRNAQPFNETDPVFARDLSFFVFKLPFHEFLFTWGFSALVVLTLVVAGAHYFLGGIRTEGPGPRVAPHVKAHLSVLLGLIVALKAWGYRLDQFNLLYSPRGGQVTGASYTDVHAQLPALRLLVVIALVCAVLFIVNLRFKGWVLPAAGIGILVLTSIIAGGVYPAAVQRLRVNPLERERERPFIERNIEATRKAFKIDDESVEVQELPAGKPLDRPTLRANQVTVDNIRLWDPQILSKAYTQLQRITSYYEFQDVDVDRYRIGNTTRQVMLAAREIYPEGLREEALTWVNRHLVYTHGYGIVASRVDQATPEGQPSFVVRDIPPRGVAGAPEITQARIYYGEKDESAQPFVVVNSGVKELDFPEGQRPVESSYEGKGGIEMTGFLRRLAFAWRFRDVNVLISGAITKDSRMMFRRNVAERVRHVAPFLRLDGDPYVVVADGRLVWVVDAYTTTANYPYSQRIDLGEVIKSKPGGLRGRANYVRNAVKATVDALDGTVTLYKWDESDPIIQTWDRVFPDLMKSRASMPEQIAAHVRYPEDLFKAQADRYATYHITDPIEFYSKLDVWRIPQNPAEPTELMPPYYVLMRLPGKTEPEFVLMTPFSPFSSGNEGANQRQNMTAWLAARSDGDKYGRLVSFVYSKDTNVFGPEQVDARIQQDPQVASTLTLLDPTKTRIRKGNLLVIPVGESLLYVQPLYLESPSSRLPEFKRVVVVTRDKVRIGETLTEALESLFGAAPEPGERPAVEDVTSLLALAQRHYGLAQDALRAGDLARYQREIAAMKAAIDRAQVALGAASPSPSPSPGASPRGSASPN